MNRRWGSTMKRAELEQMSVDHLWKLRAQISAILKAKIGEEKKLIEERLIRLRANSRQGSEIHESERRQNFETQMTIRRPGRVAGSSHGGWQRN
jgi:hypothetical protein